MSASDRSAGFEELAMPLFASLYNFAHWLTQNREEAEDLVQETYAKALKGFGSFQPGTNFRAWIFPILLQYFSDFAHRAGGDEDCAARDRRRRRADSRRVPRDAGVHLA